MTRTYTPKAGEVQREWLVIDATDVVLGRLASHAAALLRGKHKPTFANHMDMGDFVIIINADKVALTGQKLQKKKAYRHSGYPGGLKSVTYDELLDEEPRARRREGRPRHAPQEQPGCAAAHQAQGLPRRRAPPRVRSSPRPSPSTRSPSKRRPD